MLLWLFLSCSGPIDPVLELCEDGIDNDGDGLRDCFDPDCSDRCPTEQNCNDGLDDDQDQRIDCDDPDCDSVCTHELCDGEDRDSDGLVDCDDPDCSKYCPEICDDGWDNDADGDIDCTDSDCIDTPECLERCSDGEDNDGDGFTDCLDPECDLNPDCEEDCEDGIDNDEDGDVDCADKYCFGKEACLEDCFDGTDNDLDGLVDCEDADCMGICTESSCTDSVDNDLDGYIDCNDAECWGVGDCPVTLNLQLDEGRGVIRSWSSGSRWVSNGHAQAESWELDSLKGYAIAQTNSGTISCTWRASQMLLRQGGRSSLTGSQTDLTLMSAIGVSSSGGCLGVVDSADFAYRGYEAFPFTGPPFQVSGNTWLRYNTLSSSSYNESNSSQYDRTRLRTIQVTPGSWWLKANP